MNRAVIRFQGDAREYANSPKNAYIPHYDAVAVPVAGKYRLYARWATQVEYKDLGAFDGLTLEDCRIVLQLQLQLWVRESGLEANPWPDELPKPPKRGK